MAVFNPVTNSTGIFDINWANVILGIPGLGDLIAIGKAVGVAVLVYILFMIIRSIVQINYSFRFKRLTKNVEEINQKMDVLIGKGKIKNPPRTKVRGIF
jgi:hypothetical protein